MSKAEEILTTVVEAFIETGEPILISTVAKVCGTSAKAVHTALWDRHSDFDLMDVSVTSGDTWTARSRLAPAVAPSRKYLARLLKAARQGKE